jgi:hypothetical protein
MAFRFESDGVVELRFDQIEEMHPARMGTLIERLHEHSQRQRLGLLVLPGENIKVIDFNVPVFWLKTLREPGMRVVALAAVTQKRAIQVVVRALAQTLEVLKADIKVEVFAAEVEAREFLRQRLANASG